MHEASHQTSGIVSSSGPTFSPIYYKGRYQPGLSSCQVYLVPVTQRQTRYIPTSFARPINVMSRSLIAISQKNLNHILHSPLLPARKRGGSRKNSIQANAIFLNKLCSTTNDDNLYFHLGIYCPRAWDPVNAMITGRSFQISIDHHLSKFFPLI